MNVHFNPYYSTNVSNKSVKRHKQNPSFCAGEAKFAKQAQSNENIRNIFLAVTSALGLFLSGLLTSKSKKMEQKIDQMTADIKSAYENTDGNSNDFKAKTEELINYIDQNASKHYYESFVRDAIKFLQTNIELQSDCSDKDVRFEAFKDDQGNYSARWNKFMSLVNQASKDAVCVKSPKNRDYYKYDKDITVAERLMLNNQGGLSDKELNGDTYAFGVYGFTNEEPDISKALIGIQAELNKQD